jgi:hypothetical protein
MNGNCASEQSCRRSRCSEAGNGACEKEPLRPRFVIRSEDRVVCQLSWSTLQMKS